MCIYIYDDILYEPMSLTYNKWCLIWLFNAKLCLLDEQSF